MRYGCGVRRDLPTYSLVVFFSQGIVALPREEGDQQDLQLRRGIFGLFRGYRQGIGTIGTSLTEHLCPDVGKTG